MKEFIFVLPNNDIGGAQNFMKRLFKSMPMRKKSLYFENLEIYGFLNIFHRIFCLSRKIRNSKGRVVVLSTVNSMIPSAVCKIFFFKFFLVSRIGNTLSSETKGKDLHSLKLLFLHRFIFFVSDKIVFQSQSMKEDALSRLNLKDSNKFVVINNGIDFTEVESKLAKEDQIEINRDFFNFILIGSFKYQKAYDIFLDAVCLIPKPELVNMRFYICGENAYGDKVFEEFKKKLHENKLGEYINLLGWKQNPYPLINKMDAYILPSRYEGFPNSLIEALSLGLPSIVSRSPGANQEILIQGFNGLTFENENAIDLSNQIINMQKKITSFNTLKIINDVKNRFDIKKIVDQYLEVLG